VLRWAVFGLVAGGLAAVIAQVLGERRKWDQTVQRRVTIFIFVALLGLAGAATSLVKGRSTERRVARIIDRNPAFLALSRIDPGFRAGLHAFLDSLARSNASASEAFTAGVAWGQRAIGPYVSKYLPLASDSTIVAYTTTFTELARTLAASNPETCTALLFGTGRPIAKAPVIDSVLERKLFNTTARMLEEGAKSTATPLDTAGGNDLVMALIARVGAEHGPAVVQDIALLADPESIRDNAARACAATVALYATALSMRADTTVRVLRYLFAASP
jgi:hypothetical protein